MIRLLAALALVLASLSVAQARGAAGLMVICTGAGLVSVPMDPGAPASPAACPDGVLAFALAPSPPPGIRPARLVAVHAAPVAALPQGGTTPAPRARDPPAPS